jgi:tripartite-type tricarboxylate transporter receptor subunit TctC
VLPDLPTVGEFVPGYEASTFVGIGAPRNTPAEIIDKLNVEVNAALADPKRAGLRDLGYVEANFANHTVARLCREQGFHDRNALGERAI